MSRVAPISLPILLIPLYLAIFAHHQLHAAVSAAAAAAEEKIPPPRYSPEELWQLCEHFPSLRGCDDYFLPLSAEKRKSAYMRFGRADPASPTGYDHNGDGDDMIEGMEKRKSAYMRFGKRKSAYMRFGKRSANGQEEAIGDVEKRKSAYMRFGKRSSAADNQEVEKRKSAYMRFGKRSYAEGMMPELVEKRKSAYMRFGK